MTFIKTSLIPNLLPSLLSYMVLTTSLVANDLHALSRSSTNNFRIIIISSYHKNDPWSKEVHQGINRGLLEHKYLEYPNQINFLERHDTVVTSTSSLKKIWMDAKRKPSKPQVARATLKVIQIIKEFKPDIILLGDDIATNHIGNQFIDTNIPIVFWGVNGRPEKYGLINSLKHPGHNVTGIYQSEYLIESLKYLKMIKPSMKTFAILSDESPKGRTKVKSLEVLSRSGKLPLKLIQSVSTNSVEEWKSETLRLSKKVDAFFISNLNNLKTREGVRLTQNNLRRWYLQNITIPECAYETKLVKDGMLMAIDDSGVKQGLETMKIVNDILRNGKNPASISVNAPKRGSIFVNSQRAVALNINLSNLSFLEEVVDNSRLVSRVPDSIPDKQSNIQEANQP